MPMSNGLLFHLRCSPESLQCPGRHRMTRLLPTFLLCLLLPFALLHPSSLTTLLSVPPKMLSLVTPQDLCTTILFLLTEAPFQSESFLACGSPLKCKVLSFPLLSFPLPAVSGKASGSQSEDSVQPNQQPARGSHGGW